MDRLTGRNEYGVFRTRCDISDSDAWNKLTEYEDLEEKGLLIKLDIAIGKMVYGIFVNADKVAKGTIYSAEIYEVDKICYSVENDESDWFFYEESIGKTVFLTEEEAEQKLKETNK